MYPTTTGIVSVILYLVASYNIVRELRTAALYRLSIRVAWIAALCHAVYASSMFLQSGGVNFSFFNTASLVSLLVVLLLLSAAFSHPVDKLGLALYPLAAAMLVLDMSVSVKPHVLHERSLPMDVHILSSVIAFSLLNIAALQSILLAIQDRQIRSRHPHRFILSLPPLQTMETLLFQMIGTGMVFLSVSLLSGFLFIEDLFAQHLAHKTVLSIIAWLVFSGLLLGRSRYGWRGEIAIRWTLTGFAVLLLAYFGSKMVLEIILQRV
jgi:ABC-type uncharacterized transport system permease subunit